MRFETNIDNLASDSEGVIRKNELAAREFSVWEPLYLALLRNMDDPASWQKLSETISTIRQIPNVSRALSPLDATYITLQGLAIRTVPVTTRFLLRSRKSRLSGSRSKRVLIATSRQAQKATPPS
ncbi:hypothetical protein [Mesotoga sp.]|uniref:hypothetical protein n=1 Tax=Mesotoga sp. TaxID=2053577 RepID=UPI00345EC4F0